MKRYGVETDSDGRPVAYFFRRQEIKRDLERLDEWYRGLITIEELFGRMRADWDRFKKIKET